MSSTARSRYSESSDETYSPPKMSSLHSLLGDLALMPELQSPLDQQESIFSSRYGRSAVRKPLHDGVSLDRQTKQPDFDSTDVKKLASTEARGPASPSSALGTPVSVSPAHHEALHSQENDPSLQAPHNFAGSHSSKMHMKPEDVLCQSLKSLSVSPAPSKSDSHPLSASPSSILAESNIQPHTASYTDLDPILSELSQQHKGTALRPEAHPYTFRTEQPAHSRATGKWRRNRGTNKENDATSKDQKIQEDMRALFQHLDNLKLSRMSEAPPVAAAYQPHSARSSQSDSTIQSCEDSYKGNELKKAAAICHKLSSRKYQPIGLDQSTVNCLVESQINAGVPVRAPWYRTAPGRIPKGRCVSQEPGNQPPMQHSFSGRPDSGTGYFFPANSK